MTSNFNYQTKNASNKSDISIVPEQPRQEFFEHFVHNNHPLFGIEPKRFTEQLTNENWQGKGLFNSKTQDYIYLNQAVSIQKNTQYTCVNYYSAQEKTSKHHLFASVGEALQFANHVHRQAVENVSSRVATA